MRRRGLSRLRLRVNAGAGVSFRVGQGVPAVDQLDQPARVDMGVDLGGGDVGMA